jgi:hypothetical protein
MRIIVVDLEPSGSAPMPLLETARVARDHLKGQGCVFQRQTECRTIRDRSVRRAPIGSQGVGG